MMGYIGEGEAKKKICPEATTPVAVYWYRLPPVFLQVWRRIQQQIYRRYLSIHRN